MYVDLTTIVTSDAILGFALHSKSFTRRTYNTTSRVFNIIYLRMTQVSKLYLFWFDIEKSYLGTVRRLDLYKRVTSLQIRTFLQVNEAYRLFKQMNYRLKCAQQAYYTQLLIPTIIGSRFFGKYQYTFKRAEKLKYLWNLIYNKLYEI